MEMWSLVEHKRDKLGVKRKQSGGKRTFRAFVRQDFKLRHYPRPWPLVAGPGLVLSGAGNWMIHHSRETAMACATLWRRRRGSARRARAGGARPAVPRGLGPV